MPADSLLREVQDRRKKALEQLEAEYSAKREEVVKRTEQERSHILESSKREAVSLADRERTRITGATKLQAKKMIFDATEKMLESNVGNLRKTLADLAQSKEYPDLLSRMVKYASKRVGTQMKVVCRQADEPILRTAGVAVESSKLNSIGGFKAESADGTLELDLTFEEVLRNHEEQARASILGKE